MWQRIQTLYLFLSTVLSGLMFFFDKAPGVRYTAYIPYAVLMVIILLRMSKEKKTAIDIVLAA